MKNNHWETHTTSLNTKYYYNTYTGESTFDIPDILKTEESSIKDTYTEYTTSIGRPYYYNKNTNTSTYHINNKIKNKKYRINKKTNKHKSINITAIGDITFSDNNITEQLFYRILEQNNISTNCTFELCIKYLSEDNIFNSIDYNKRKIWYNKYINRNIEKEEDILYNTLINDNNLDNNNNNSNMNNNIHGNSNNNIHSNLDINTNNNNINDNNRNNLNSNNNIITYNNNINDIPNNNIITLNDFIRKYNKLYYKHPYYKKIPIYNNIFNKYKEYKIKEYYKILYKENIKNIKDILLDNKKDGCYKKIRDKDILYITKEINNNYSNITIILAVEEYNIEINKKYNKDIIDMKNRFIDLLYELHYNGIIYYKMDYNLFYNIIKDNKIYKELEVYDNRDIGSNAKDLFYDLMDLLERDLLFYEEKYKDCNDKKYYIMKDRNLSDEDKISLINYFYSEDKEEGEL